MGTKRKQSPLKAFIQTVFEDPARLLEWTLFGLIVFLLLRVGYAFGGSFEFGFGLAAAVPLVYAIVFVFALWGFATRSSLRVPVGPLFALPFVLWTQIQSQLFSNGEWISEGTASALLMAWIVYLVVTTALRRRVFLYSLLLSLVGVVVFLGAFSLGVFRWYALTPEINSWLLGQSRSVVAPFGHPTAGAFAYLIAVPLGLVVAILPRFPGFVRMGAGSIAVISIGFASLGGTITGLVAIVFIVIFVPFFLTTDIGLRLRLVAAGLALLLCFQGIFFLGFYPVRTAIERQLEEQSSLVETTRWAASFQTFLENPIVGSGLGTGAIEAERSLQTPNGTDAWGVRNTPLEILTETGLIGAILALVGLGGTLGRLFLCWKREPFYSVDKEAAYRNSSGPGEGQIRRSRSRSKSKFKLKSIFRFKSKLKSGKKLSKRTSTKKVLLGGIVASLCFGLVYSVFESAWSSLLSWLLLAILMGIAERFSEEKVRRPSSHSRGVKMGRFAIGLGCCVLAFLTIGSLGVHNARADVFRADVSLQEYRDKPFLAFENPGRVGEIRRLLGYALSWQPGNADALALKAESFLMEEFIARMPLEEAGEMALQYSQDALELYPENGYFIYLEASAKALVGAPEGEVEDGYRRASELMPTSERVLVAWANYRIRDLRKPGSARELVDRVLELDPSNPKALELLDRINL